MLNITPENLDIIPSNHYPEIRRINNFKFRPILKVLLGILTVFTIQAIDRPKTLAFNIIPKRAVSTALTSVQYFGLGNYFQTFQVEVSNYPKLNPKAKLMGFELSFTPIGYPPSPPYPEIFPEGGIDLSGDTDTSLQTPFGWQLTKMGRIPSYFCGGGLILGDPYCTTISIPTMTFKAINLNAGVSPGSSLGGFGVAYNTGCGIYCTHLQQSVIAISSSSIPEPVTILGSAIALGFGISLKRKLAKPNSKQDLKINLKTIS